MEFLTFGKKFDLVDIFFCSKNICKLSCASSVIIFLYFSSACRETARDVRLPDFSELLQNPTSPVRGGPTVTFTRENKDPEVQLVIFFAQARGVMSLMEHFYPVQSNSDERKILQLVQSGYLFDSPKP